MKLIPISTILFSFIFCAHGVAAGESEESQEYTDYFAGEDFPAGFHYYLKYGEEYVADIWRSVSGYSGEFFGTSNYEGDRRFNPFSVSYRIKIEIRSRQDIHIDWECKQRLTQGGSWNDENPKMMFKNVKYGGPNLIWGDMYFCSKKGEQLMTNPFLAAFVVRKKDKASGLLLTGRYEGPVFLRRRITQP